MSDNLNADGIGTGIEAITEEIPFYKSHLAEWGVIDD
jgi:hypothetical protein